MRDHTNFTTLVTVVDEYVELTISPELNAPGTGSITFDADAPFWERTMPNGRPPSDLLDYEYLWEAYEDGVLRFQWLGEVVEQRLVEEDETRQVTISGPGAAQTLAWGVVFPPYFPPATNAIQTAEKYNWIFKNNPPAMKCWLTLLNACKKRGTLKWISPMFTAVKDSGGVAWAPVTGNKDSTVVPELGTNLLDLLTIYTGQDTSKQIATAHEWYMRPGFKLDVRKTIGTARQGTVIFFEGGVEVKERTRTREAVANYVATLDINGSTSLASDSASITHWGRREQLQTQNKNVTDASRRAAITRTFLALAKDEQSQWTLTVPYDQPGRRVFRNFGIGDWIGVSRYTAGATSSVEPFRVMAITVNVRDSVPTVELTLQTKLDARLLENQRTLGSILNTLGNLKIPDIGKSTDDGTGGGDTGGGGTGTGTGGGVKVFIQQTDPGSAASTGDIWVQTAFDDL